MLHIKGLFLNCFYFVIIKLHSDGGFFLKFLALMRVDFTMTVILLRRLFIQHADMALGQRFQIRVETVKLTLMDVHSHRRRHSVHFVRSEFN